jgi:HSP20 family protein
MSTSLQTHESQTAQRMSEAPAVIPRADVRDAGEALEVQLDMPGVSEGAIEVSLEAGTLTVHGTRSAEPMEGYRPVLQEYEPVSYHRVFKVGSEIDAEKIEARVKQGVLSLRLPKATTARPRRIAVSAA